MTDIQLYNQISDLPSELKKKVSEFISSIKKKSIAENKIKERHFGATKGCFEKSDDFNEPLDDFKEYI